ALNAGRAGFAPQPDIPGGDLLNVLGLGDLDGDGDLDAVVSENGQVTSLRVFVGNGACSLPARRDHILADTTSRLVLRDVNLDGRADLVRTLAITSKVEVRLGTALGALGPPMSFGSVGFSAGRLEAGDLDED